MANPDIQGYGSRQASKSSYLRSYRFFVAEGRTTLLYNAKAYTNKVIRKDGKRPGTRRLLQIATYLPANENRYYVGQQKSVRHFVIHRPGLNPKASRFDNVIKTFAEPVGSSGTAGVHFVISKYGVIAQLVELQDMTPHVGIPKSAGLSPSVINSNSVGVELEGAVGEPFLDAQLVALAKLLKHLSAAYGITWKRAPLSEKNLWGHSEIWPYRYYPGLGRVTGKQDPGTNFNYDLLLRLIDQQPSVSSTAIWSSPTSRSFEASKSLAQMQAEARMSPDQIMMRHAKLALGNMSSTVRAMQLLSSSRSAVNAYAAQHATSSSASMYNQLAAALRIESYYEKGVGETEGPEGVLGSSGPAMSAEAAAAYIATLREIQLGGGIPDGYYDVDTGRYGDGHMT